MLSLESKKGGSAQDDKEVALAEAHPLKPRISDKKVIVAFYEGVKKSDKKSEIC